jgi:hypothetical protein
MGGFRCMSCKEEKVLGRSARSGLICEECFIASCPNLDNGGGCELMSFRSCKDNYDNCPLENHGR